MKAKSISILLFVLLVALTSCEEDEGLLPKITFKSGANYTSSDVTLAGGTSLKIGIDASKSEDKDVLKKFNISKSIGGGAATTVFSKSLSGSEGDTFTYDYSEVLETKPSQINKYTFTVTNRDGLVNQVAVSVTIQ